MYILNDEDVTSVPMRVYSDAIANFLLEAHRNNTISPARHSVTFPQGQLVFTCGGSEQLAGFRAYETFQPRPSDVENQLVAVWDTTACTLKGVCAGSKLGALRTGAIGGIAVDKLASASANSCAIVGTGLQAQTQLQGILALREINEVRVYSRSEKNREEFAENFPQCTDMQLCNTPEEAVTGAEIIVMATNSGEPVVRSDWLRSAKHISTVGPKTKNAHELPLEIINSKIAIYSDSPEQISAMGSNHMLAEHQPGLSILHLGGIDSTTDSIAVEKTLFLSAGLAGTEVIALDAAITYLMSTN